jgi:thiamine biosynthesis protein ThiC
MEMAGLADTAKHRKGYSKKRKNRKWETRWNVSIEDPNDRREKYENESKPTEFQSLASFRVCRIC